MVKLSLVSNYFIRLSVTVSNLVLISAVRDESNFSWGSTLPFSINLDDNSSQQVQEFCLNLMKQSDHHSFTLILSCNEPSLPYGNCATFDQSTNTVSISNCPNFQ